MADTLKVSFKINRRLLQNIERGARRGLEIGGKKVVDTIRSGGFGSIQWQFDSQKTYAKNTRIPWQKNRPFGSYTNEQPGVLSGRYRSAWLGGADSKTQIQPRKITVGVSRSKFPFVTVLNSFGTRVLRPKDPDAMRKAIAYKWGVFLSTARVRRGFRVSGRPVRMNDAIEKRAADILVKEWAALIRRER